MIRDLGHSAAIYVGHGLISRRDGRAELQPPAAMERGAATGPLQIEGNVCKAKPGGSDAGARLVSLSLSVVKDAFRAKKAGIFDGASDEQGERGHAAMARP